jgi:hypothetical protein
LRSVSGLKESRQSESKLRDGIEKGQSARFEESGGQDEFAKVKPLSVSVMMWIL